MAGTRGVQPPNLAGAAGAGAGAAGAMGGGGAWEVLRNTNKRELSGDKAKDGAFADAAGVDDQVLKLAGVAAEAIAVGGKKGYPKVAKENPKLALVISGDHFPGNFDGSKVRTNDVEKLAAEATKKLKKTQPTEEHDKEEITFLTNRTAADDKFAKVVAKALEGKPSKVPGIIALAIKGLKAAKAGKGVGGLEKIDIAERAGALDGLVEVIKSTTELNIKIPDSFAKDLTALKACNVKRAEEVKKAVIELAGQYKAQPPAEAA